MTGSFDALAGPIELRGIRIRNRIAMAPMCAMYAHPDGSVSERMVEYYRARARGGAGIVIAEITFTDTAGSRAFHAQLGAHDDRMIPGLSDLAEAIRAEGAVPGLQLGHCGAQRVVSEPPVVAASPIPWAPGKRTPRALSTAEVAQIVDDHAAAARRLVQAGFELIELHGAHGYLLNGFLSPATNLRNDRYGGDPERRLRFPLEVVRAVREELGEDRILSFRLNGDDLLPGGLGIQEYCEVAVRLVEAGVDLVHVSAGTYRVMEQRITPMYLEEAPFAAFSGPIRRACGAAVMASGSIHDPALAESLVAGGEADFVSMARPLFADPELPRKLLGGRISEIRPCIRCNTCVSREQGGARGLCAVNPRTGREHESRIPPRLPGRVLVIGGGPSGIEAALSAARQGASVRLVEREQVLGGQVAVAAALPFKQPMRKLVRYWLERIADSGIEVELGRDVDPAEFEGFDLVVVATGAQQPIDQRIAGTGNDVVGIIDALRDPVRLGDRVAVIGATGPGVETAWYLAGRGHTVTLIEGRDDWASDINLISRLVLPNAIREAGVSVRFGTRVVGRSGDSLRLHTADGEDLLEIDSVVQCFGRRPVDDYPTPLMPTAGRRMVAVGERAGHRGLIGATASGFRALVEW